MAAFLSNLYRLHGGTVPVHAVGTRGDYVIRCGDTVTEGVDVTGIVIELDNREWHAFAGDDVVAAGVLPAQDFFIVLAPVQVNTTKVQPHVGSQGEVA